MVTVNFNTMEEFEEANLNDAFYNATDIIACDDIIDTCDEPVEEPEILG